MMGDIINVYVAGKTHDYEKVRQVQALVRRYGKVTFDWTEVVEQHGPAAERAPLTQELARSYAASDLAGVFRADVVIALPHPRLCGTLMEIGAAIASGTPVIMLGQPSQRSVFWAFTKVWRTADYWPSCEHDLDSILQFITTFPGYPSQGYGRDLARLATPVPLESDSDVHQMLFPVDIEGLEHPVRASGSSSGQSMKGII